MASEARSKYFEIGLKALVWRDFIFVCGCASAETQLFYLPVDEHLMCNQGMQLYLFCSGGEKRLSGGSKPTLSLR